MSRSEIIERERRWARPVAIAAFAVLVLFVAGIVIGAGVDAGDPDSEASQLEAIDAGFDTLLLSAIVTAISLALMAPVLIYLFRAAQARSEKVRGALLGLTVAGPLFFAVGWLIRAIALGTVAGDFVDDGSGCALDDNDCIEALITDDGMIGASRGLLIAGGLGLGAGLVYTCLWAMRTGLLTRFLGTLGMAVGAATIIFGPYFTTVYILGLGFVYMGWIPGGRPPAWAKGEAVPWPAPGQGRPPGPDPDEPVEGKADEIFPDAKPLPEGDDEDGRSARARLDRRRGRSRRPPGRGRRAAEAQAPRVVRATPPCPTRSSSISTASCSTPSSAGTRSSARSREAWGGRWSEDAPHDMMGMSSPEWSAYMRDTLGVPRDAGEINDEVVRRLAASYRDELPLLPGAVEAVRALGRTWPLALASSSNREVIDDVLRLAGIEEEFRVTLSSEQVERGKPAPDVYLEAARRLGVRPGRRGRDRGLVERDPRRPRRRHAGDRDPERALSAGARRARPCRGDDRRRRRAHTRARRKPKEGPGPLQSASALRGLAADLLLERLDDARVAQRGDVAELVAGGDVAQQAAHDLARAGLRQVVGEGDPLRAGELADLVGDVLAQLVRRARRRPSRLPRG